MSSFCMIRHGFGNYSCIRSDSELTTDFTGEQQWADQDTNTSWPADEVLNARIERIVDAFRQAQQRKEDLHARCVMLLPCRAPPVHLTQKDSKH